MNLLNNERLIIWRKSLTWKVLKNTGWASASTPITVVLGVIQTGLIARLLGPEGVGAIALFGAICTMLGSLFKVTSAEAAIVFTTKAISEGNREQADHLIRYFYSIDFYSSLFAFIFCTLSALFLPKLLNIAPGNEWLQIIFGLTIIFQSTYWTSHALLRFLNKFSWAFYQSVAHSLIKTIILYIIFLFNSDISKVIYLIVVMSLFDGLSLYIMSNIALHRQGIGKSKLINKWWRVPKEVWHFQVLGYGRQLIKSMNRYVDTLMIGYISNPKQVGFYRSGKQITDQTQTPAQGFLVSLFPEYSSLYYQGDKKRLRKLVKRFVFLFIILGILASLILWFGAEWIILIILGKEFLPAKEIIRILMISAVIQLIMSPIYSLPAAVGKAWPALISVMIALIVQIVLIINLVPKMGALGAAWSNVAYVFIWAISMLPSILNVLKVNDFNK